MINEKVINAALEKASRYCEEKEIVCDNESLRKNIIVWYSYTDITDPEILAAAALEFSTFECLPMSILVMITDTYFPKYPIEIEDNFYF